MSGKSIFDKLWDRHVIGDEGNPNLCMDQHYIHEVTSPCFLRDAGRKVRRPDLDFWDL